MLLAGMTNLMTGRPDMSYSDSYNDHALNTQNHSKQSHSKQNKSLGGQAQSLSCTEMNPWLHPLSTPYTRMLKMTGVERAARGGGMQTRLEAEVAGHTENAYQPA